MAVNSSLAALMRVMDECREKIPEGEYLVAMNALGTLHREDEANQRALAEMEVKERLRSISVEIVHAQKETINLLKASMAHAQADVIRLQKEMAEIVASRRAEAAGRVQGVSKRTREDAPLPPAVEEPSSKKKTTSSKKRKD